MRSTSELELVCGVCIPDIFALSQALHYYETHLKHYAEETKHSVLFTKALEQNFETELWCDL